jgi:hypothetical protein
MEYFSCARMQGTVESNASYADNTCMREPNVPIIKRIFWLFDKVGRRGANGRVQHYHDVVFIIKVSGCGFG